MQMLQMSAFGYKADAASQLACTNWPASLWEIWAPYQVIEAPYKVYCTLHTTYGSSEVHAR